VAAEFFDAEHFDGGLQFRKIVHLKILFAQQKLTANATTANSNLDHQPFDAPHRRIHFIVEGKRNRRVGIRTRISFQMKVPNYSQIHVVTQI